jgi:TetR/AcrR family transcriptional repressor of nem operon
MGLLQTHGYNGFSFHDLAAAQGIKTASIHYHFPTKGDLAISLAQAYRTNFMTTLGEPCIRNAAEQIDRYVGLFRTTLQKGQFCLCGMMAAEVSELPSKAKVEVVRFFDDNREWLAAVLEQAGHDKARARNLAVLTVASLEGALLMARAGEALASFDIVADTIRAVLLPTPVPLARA